jgi:hypothetical protein
MTVQVVVIDDAAAPRPPTRLVYVGLDALLAVRFLTVETVCSSSSRSGRSIHSSSSSRKATPRTANTRAQQHAAVGIFAATTACRHVVNTPLAAPQVRPSSDGC